MAKTPESRERDVIDKIKMAEACLDDAEDAARVLALGLMGFDEVRKILRAVKGDLALRMLDAERRDTGSDAG